MNAMQSGIYLSPDQWEQMKKDVAVKAPEEACGFVVGKGSHAKMIIPVSNSLHDSYRFRMDPQEELNAFLLVEENGWEILAIYHSHPNGISSPSKTDYKELTFPGVLYLIWFQHANQWHCRGFIMDVQAGTGEVPINISTSK